MSVYHQMGHHSENLLDKPELKTFAGALLSPTNYDKDEIAFQIKKHSKKPSFEIIFDPQLYYPQSERGVLKDWPYFPAELDTADLSSSSWWDNLNDELIKTLGIIQPHAVCSPVAVPRAFSNSYYVNTVCVADTLAEKCKSTGFNVLQTVLVNFDEIADLGKVFSIASIVSRSKLNRVYLVFVSDIEPRRELNDTESLKGAMRLIHELKIAGLEVLVGFCSSDLVLWKAAGATSCATGKFFNLRRFTKSRWEEPREGGGQLAYWFEEGLLAFLRESDIVRVQKESIISRTSLENPFCKQILENFKEAPGTAWLGLSWQQYLYWFADVEARISKDTSIVKDLLKTADTNWAILEDKDVFMEERRNDGQWIRFWRRALAEYLKS